MEPWSLWQFNKPASTNEADEQQNRNHPRETSCDAWTIVKLQVLRLRAREQMEATYSKQKWVVCDISLPPPLDLKDSRSSIPETRYYWNITLSIGWWALPEWRGNWTIIRSRRSITSCMKCMTHLKKVYQIASERIPQSTPMTIQRALSISITSVIWWPNLCKAKGNVPYELLQYHDGDCVVWRVSSVSASFLCSIFTV